MKTKPAFKDLDAWQQGMSLVEAIYKATRSFPREELYGLSSQMRRAAVSIPSNIAEGYCRRSTKSYVYHVSVALGSHAELETCLDLTRRLEFLSAADYERFGERTNSVGRLLSGLHRSLEERLARSNNPNTSHPPAARS
jgi:four helix bundle protein